MSAAIDTESTETGGFLLNVPGVANDFVLFADGQWFERSNGTARLSAFAVRDGALDRDLYLELELTARLQPGDASYPPVGYPITTLMPSAYTPVGTIDPSTYVYYETVTGTITGLRAYRDLRVDVVGLGAMQIGPGASNKNVLAGLAVDLQLTILQSSSSDPFAPTGNAELRANFEADAVHCASHAEPDPAVSTASNRLAFSLPGFAEDFVFMPTSEFTETDLATATLNGEIRRQSDYTNAWTVQLSFSQRVDPGDTNFPPAGTLPLDLLPSAYAGAGGPVQTADWRYYETVTGTLTGLENNDGAIVDLSEAAPAQLGVGANQANTFFGLAASLQTTIVSQPTAYVLQLNGGSAYANFGRTCILPAPIVTAGDAQVIDTVTDQKLVFTGTDLGFVVQAAIANDILHSDERSWFDGFFRVIDHTTLELSIPQGRAASSYPLRFLNPSRASNQLTVTTVEPTQITLATEPDRLLGEPQSWVTHQGSVQGFAFCFVIVSFSDLPSFAPGIVTLDIGNQFADYLLLDVLVQDAVTRTSVLGLGAVPASLIGMRMHAQSALMDNTFFPLQPSNATFTDY